MGRILLGEGGYNSSLAHDALGTPLSLLLQFYNRYNPSLPGPGTPLPAPCGVYSVRTSCLLRGADGTVASDGPTDMPFAPPLPSAPCPFNRKPPCPGALGFF